MTNKNVLQELYFGNINLIERYQPIAQKHKKLLENENEHFEEFKRKLEKTDSSLISEFVNLYNEMYREIPFESAEAFVCGVRFGAKMMMEIMEENQ